MVYFPRFCFAPAVRGSVCQFRNSRSRSLLMHKTAAAAPSSLHGWPARACGEGLGEAFRDIR